MHVTKTGREALAFVMVCGLCVLYFAEWRRSRSAFEGLAASFKGEVAGLRKLVEGEFLKTNSMARALAREVNLIKESRQTPATGQGEPPGVASDAPEGGVQDATTNDGASKEASFPELPKGISDPVSFVRSLDPERFFSDPAYNPQSRELRAMEKLQVGCELAIAQSRIEILEKEIQKICVTHVDRMREEGAYVEYGPGEPPDPAHVITFGEATERGGMRIYYFYPEEFKEIYAKEQEKKKTGELLVRRLLQFAQPRVPEGGR